MGPSNDLLDVAVVKPDARRAPPGELGYMAEPSAILKMSPAGGHFGGDQPDTLSVLRASGREIEWVD